MSAIFHFSVQIISRAKGRSSLAAAAYRAAEKLKNEQGEVYNYTRKTGVFHSEILLPPAAPSAYQNRQDLWQAVEKSEKRRDAQLAREIDIALPSCLNHEQKIQLAKDFANDIFVSNGMIADLCFHDLDSHNPHVHIMLTTREVSADGFGKKNRDWNNRQLLIEWREKWAAYANEVMKQAGHDLHIDHRTLEEQGINRTPQVHKGPARAAMEKKGIQLDSIEQQKQRQQERRAENAAIDEIINNQDKANKREVSRLELELEKAKFALTHLLGVMRKSIGEKVDQAIQANPQLKPKPEPNSEPPQPLNAGEKPKDPIKAFAMKVKQLLANPEPHPLVTLLTEHVNNGKKIPIERYQANPKQFFSDFLNHYNQGLSPAHIQEALDHHGDELKALIHRASQPFIVRLLDRYIASGLTVPVDHYFEDKYNFMYQLAKYYKHNISSKTNFKKAVDTHTDELTALIESLPDEQIRPPAKANPPSPSRPTPK